MNYMMMPYQTMNYMMMPILLNKKIHHVHVHLKISYIESYKLSQSSEPLWLITISIIVLNPQTLAVFHHFLCTHRRLLYYYYYGRGFWGHVASITLKISGTM